MKKRDVALPDINFIDGSIEHFIDILALFEERHTMIKECTLTRDSSGIKVIGTDTDGYEYVLTRTEPKK